MLLNLRLIHVKILKSLSIEKGLKAIVSLVIITSLHLNKIYISFKIYQSSNPHRVSDIYSEFVHHMYSIYIVHFYGIYNTCL